MEEKLIEKYHIIVVDDDKKLRSLLVDFVGKQDSYLASWAKDADEAYKIASNISVDLMILDVMMPGMNGFEFVKKLRKEGFDFPILMLSALGDSNNKIEGLKLGADDYLSKPFSSEELLLRIKNILSRVYIREKKQKYNDDNKFSFGDGFEFNFSKGFLTKYGEVIDLSSSEVKLLKIFINNTGKELSRDDLADQLGLEENYRAVDVQVTRLRKKIEENPKNPNFILTIRNKGYKFISY